MPVVNPGKSRQLTVVFVAVLVPAAATLVWLGLRLLEQDRILYGQRIAEQQAASADAVVRRLGQLLAGTERRVLDGKPVAGAVLLRRTADGVTVRPQFGVAWMPASPTALAVPTAVFAQAEAFEYQGNPARALSVYSGLTRSPDAAVRAGAFLRTARVRRQRGDIAAAILDYRSLATLEGVSLDGMPVDLLARRTLCDLMTTGTSRESFSEAVAALERDFTAGRWSLPRDAWELVAADVSRWTGRRIAPTTDQRALSATAEWFGARARGGRLEPVFLTDDGAHVTVLRRDDADAAHALAIAPSAVEGWLATAAADLSLDPASLSLLNDRGETIAGGAATPGARLVRRTPAETGLPWGVALAPGNAPAVSEEFQSRRRLLAMGLGALGLLLAGGAYLLWRVVQREIAVARLQAEFVAAVSHEFRTPVTSLRHSIELLQEDDDVARERRVSFYDVMSRSTERLHRLVESLLDFARMEDGRKPYDLQPVDPAALVTDIVRDFRDDSASRGYQVAVTIAPGTLGTIRADAAAVGHALWNLLDNAVKYSPDGTGIAVSVTPHPRGLAIAVADEGLGIPRDERGDIFLKFVRGEQASRLGIKGTGVGLAIVCHIMRAHGGSVELDSEPGKGSTFRLILPVAS